MAFLGKYRLKKYLLAYTLKSMPIVYILVLGIVCILFMPISFKENASAWIGGYILAPLYCFYLLKGVVKDAMVLKRQWTELEQQGKLDEILADFGKSQKAIDGNLSIGEKYLFGKGSMRIVAYSSIRRAYMENNVDRRGRHPRDLRYEDLSGEQYFICQLDPMGKSHSALDEIYRIISKKNPTAQTGL